MADKVGVYLTKPEVDVIIGTHARKLNEIMLEAEAIKEWFDARTVADLEGLGYTTSEANLAKSAVANLAAVVTTYEANKVFLSRIYGFGITLIG